MKRTDALAITNAMRMVAHAANYLILPTAGAGRVGTEPYRHEVARVREKLLDMLHDHAMLGDWAQRTLTAYDDWPKGGTK